MMIYQNKQIAISSNEFIYYDDRPAVKHYLVDVFLFT